MSEATLECVDQTVDVPICWCEKNHDYMASGVYLLYACVYRCQRRVREPSGV